MIRNMNCLLCMFFFIFLITGCSMLPGIAYPRYVYDITPTEARPPEKPAERIAAGDKYPEVFTIYFSRGVNSFTTGLITTVFVDKPYENLLIHELSCLYEGEHKILARNLQFHLNSETYRTDGLWYWKPGLGRPIHRINFGRFFRGKEPGDVFPFTLIIRFSLDDEPIREQVTVYTATVYKNRYIPFYIGP